MNVRKLCCQGCGADLEVSDDIRFVNCNYCGARLEIVRDSSTTHSRLLDQIHQRTGAMAEDLRVIRLQNELEQLDREWQTGRARFLVSDKHGNVSEPSAVGSIIGGIIMIGAGIIWMAFTASMGAPSVFPLFGLVFIGVAVFNMISSSSKAQGLRDHESDYQQKRARLLTEIQRAKAG